MSLAQFRPQRARARVAFLLPSILLLAALTAPSARADCPASEVICDQETYAPTTPTFHTSCEDVVMAVGSTDYNAPAGTIHLSYDERLWVSVSLRDVFTVNGPPAGSPVTLHLRIRFHGTEGGYGSAPGLAGLVSARPLSPQAGDVPAQKAFGVPDSFSGTRAFADSLDFTLARTAGASVGIEIHAESDYGYGFDNQVSYTFLDLPPGATVTSCQGYVQDQPVPAHPASWGSVKAAYR